MKEALKGAFAGRPRGIEIGFCWEEAGGSAEVAGDIPPGWTESRRAEFVRGRVAANQAMSRLGMSQRQVPSGPDGRPLFPSGIVGSIAHKRGIAVAAVGHADAFTGVGVDIDFNDDRDADLAHRFGSEHELAEVRLVASSPASTLFTIKEAVYKSVSAAPEHTSLDFKDVALESLRGAGFSARIVRSGQTVVGLIQLIGPFLVGLAWVSPPITPRRNDAG